MKTGILGGSFNPIHNGHIALARQLLSLAGLDEIWLMVSPQNPLKSQASLLDENERFRLVSLALADEPGLRASDYEFHLPKPSYTWDTLQHLRHDFPDRRFSLLIGGDNWACFDRWAHADELLQNYDIFVYPRDREMNPVQPLPPRVKIVHTPLLPVSSTEVRECIRAGKPFEQLVPPAVADEIKKHHLYGAR